MKYTRYILWVIVIIAIQNIQAQSLRPSGIAAERMAFWQHRGLLWELSPLSQPYTVEKTLLSMQVRAFDEDYYDYLNRLPVKPWQLGLWLESENYYQDIGDHQGYLSRQRMTFHIPVTPWLSVTNTVYANNRLDDDPNYMGKRQNSLTGYTERAVISAHYKGFEAHIGRDHLVWGPGRDAALLISDHSRPMDQIRLGYRRSWFHYEFFTATLDPSRFSTKEGPARQRRYITGHRLEIQPFKRLVIGISEAILFAEPDAGINLALFNPVIFYHGVQLNGPDTGNTVGSLNIAWMPTSYWTLYGDLMIDDIQLESSVPGDREPNAYGLLVGSVISDPFDIQGAETTIEYTRITNRTYNGQGGPWERWLHRREPLGHRMGNDFDRLLFGIEYWPVFTRRFQLTYEHIRKGEGRITDPFDMPWLDSGPAEGYSEPFPTGVVETSDILSASLTWQPRWWGRVFVQASHWSVGNPDHITDTSDSYWTMQAGVQIDWGAKWRMP